MEKEATILNFEKIANTYKVGIPQNQFKKLRSQKWAPIKENSQFAKTTAYVIGKVMGDGHLDSNFTTSFISNNKKELKNLKILLSNVYNLNQKHCTIKERKSLGYSSILNIHDCLFGRILFCLGAPKGNKTKKAFLIPKWIFNSKNNSKSFLKGLLEDELTTIKIEKNNYSVSPILKMSKDKTLADNLEIFLKQIKFLLERFNVACSSIRCENTNKKTKSLYIKIYRNKQNIINFYKNIGFGLNSEKNLALHECVKILRRTMYNRKPLVDIKKIIQLRLQGLSIRQISILANLNKTSVHRVLSKNSAGARI